MKKKTNKILLLSFYGEFRLLRSVVFFFSFHLGFFTSFVSFYRSVCVHRYEQLCVCITAVHLLTQLNAMALDEI